MNTEWKQCIEAVRNWQPNNTPDGWYGAIGRT